MAKKAVLLMNLGTPEGPTTPAVRRYLREFLSDPRVIDIPAILRFILVQCIIAPFRSPKSAHAYQQVWTEQGSPLLVAGKDLAAGVQRHLGSDYKVYLAMRYGQPSMRSVVAELCRESFDEVIALPLFPQYASATTASAIEELMRCLQQELTFPALRVLPDFFAEPGFIKAFVAVAEPQIEEFAPEHILFSYHGLPESQVKKADRTGQHCLQKSDCCQVIDTRNRYCYRAQCFATSRALAAGLSLTEGKYSSSFQSRLGRAAWIKPYTDDQLKVLRDQGVKRLAVMCPAFVADCLETLEEIGMRGAEDWKALGGEELRLIRSLDGADIWCQTVASWVR